MHRVPGRITAFTASILLATLATACSKGDTRQTGAPATTNNTGGGTGLTGAGSTFAYPLYSRWSGDYAARTGVKVNYQSIGSGGGIRQLSEQTVDFGATDGPMSATELSKAKGGPVLHIPTALGAVVLTYNLPGNIPALKFSGDVVARIFLGKVTKWNDPAIVTLNPGAKLPAQDIMVVHRSDGSGTTYVFTDYLTAVSPEWAKGPGKGKEVAWPVGLGGKGNEGVTGQVKQTPGAIGYVELAYAKQNALPVASVRNASGNFVEPTIASVTAAAAGVADTLTATSDYRISIVNAPGAQAYPIATFTWILLYQHQADSAKGRRLVDFITWGLTDGQKVAPALDYAPLPGAMAPRLVERLRTVTFAAGH